MSQLLLQQQTTHKNNNSNQQIHHHNHQNVQQQQQKATTSMNINNSTVASVHDNNDNQKTGQQNKSQQQQHQQQHEQDYDDQYEYEQADGDQDDEQMPDSDQYIHHDRTNSSQLTIKNTQQQAQRAVAFQKQMNKIVEKPLFGNMIMFLYTNAISFSIGPNYIFFLIAYSCFTIATIYLVGLVNNTSESLWFRIANFIICWGQNLSYLSVGLSNPGIVFPSKNIQYVTTDSEFKAKRLCRKCGAEQARKTFHCSDCNICVQNFDHHCPWTSKCIGGNNLKRFYAFVCITPFYIFYYMITFMICMATIQQANGGGHHKNLQKYHTV